MVQMILTERLIEFVAIYSNFPSAKRVQKVTEWDNEDNFQVSHRKFVAISKQDEESFSRTNRNQWNVLRKINEKSNKYRLTRFAIDMRWQIFSNRFHVTIGLWAESIDNKFILF